MKNPWLRLIRHEYHPSRFCRSTASPLTVVGRGRRFILDSALYLFTIT